MAIARAGRAHAPTAASRVVRRLAVPVLLAAASGGSVRSAPSDDVRHVFYVHGRIVQEEQSRRPRSPRFGDYELDAILAALRRPGFDVVDGIRPKEATVSESADRLASRVRELLASGTPPERIAIVGASMGAAITLRASARLRNPRLQFAVLGACFSREARAILKEEGKPPLGRVLSIRESSDEFTLDCAAFENPGGSHPALVVREIVLHTGLSHGFLYRPLPEWVDPVVAFIQARDTAPAGGS